MPGIGGISIATNLLANAVALNLNRNQGFLQTAVTRLSSGLRINTAADDPSGLAIATRLNAQSQAFDQASLNVQDANNAATVADGALQTETNILQRIRSLAVEAASDIDSDNDKLSLQAEVSQLLLEVNRISQNTSFNGSPLLDGTYAGFQPYVHAADTITSNAVLASSGNLIAGVTQITSTGTPANGAANGTQLFDTTNAGAVDGTIELQVINTSSTTVAVQVSFFSSTSGPGTGAVVVSASAGAGTLVQVDGLNITIGNVGVADAGTTGYIKVSQAVAASSSAAGPLTIQSGELMGGKPKSEIKVKTVSDSRGMILVNIPGAIPSRLDRMSVGRSRQALQWWGRGTIPSGLPSWQGVTKLSVSRRLCERAATEGNSPEWESVWPPVSFGRRDQVRKPANF
jgi:flagellin